MNENPWCRRAAMRARILAFLETNGPATCLEIEEAFRCVGKGFIAPRLTELARGINKGPPLIKDAGTCRRYAMGRPAIIWAIRK